MINYIGYFKGMDTCTNYSVKIISNKEDSDFTEISLAGSQPFVVSYNTSSNPFDPSRTSTATLNVIVDDYLMDVYGPLPHSTQVILTNEDEDKIEWVGFLTPNMSNMDYSNDYVVCSMECSDAVLSLQYFDYKPLRDDYSIVSFRDILGYICDTSELLDEIIITDSKLDKVGEPIRLEDLTISELNFFSTDEEKEAWKLKDVLDEICKYLGYTAMQWGNKLYLLDYQSMRDNATMSVYSYKKSDDYETAHTATLEKDGERIADSEAYRESSNDISLDNIYNKIRVKDSFSKVDDFLPSILDDEFLWNRYSGVDGFKEIVPDKYRQGDDAYYAKYVNAKDVTVKEGVADTDYKYYQKAYSHKYYESVYRKDGQLVPDSGDGVVELSLVNYSRNMTYDRKYDLECLVNISNPFEEMIDVWTDIYPLQGSSYHSQRIFRIKPRTTQQCLMKLSITDAPDYITSGYPIFYYKVNNGPQYGPFRCEDNPDRVTTSCVGATILDLAMVEIGNSELYNYEVANSIDFRRYLYINQDGQPTSTWTSRTLDPKDIETYFPAVFKLKDGYRYPVILSSESYLTIDCKAIYERYFKRDYINPKWTSENTGILGINSVKVVLEEDGTINFDPSLKGDGYNALKATSAFFHARDMSKWEYIITERPILHFKLGIGDRWWNGTSWQDVECGFRVNLSTPTKKDGYIDYSKWWNTEHHVLNNVPWTDWTGASGYKIPFDNTLNFSEDIHFSILLPCRIQEYHSENTKMNGMNGSVWLKDLELNLYSKGTEDAKDEDVVYENVILEGAVNEYSDINCKITTYPGNAKLSYSNVAYKGSMLEGITERSINGNFQKPEENIVEKYYIHYSTPTKKENLVLANDYVPWNKIFDPYWGQDFLIMGQTIDYMADTQELNLVEQKLVGSQPETVDILGVRLGQSDPIQGDGGSATLLVLSNRPWTLSSDYYNMSFAPDHGDASPITQQVVLTLGPNIGYSPSEFKVVLTNDKGTEATCMVKQLGLPQDKPSRPYFDVNACITCGACYDYDGDESVMVMCPVNVGPIRIVNGAPSLENLDSCIGCGYCIETLYDVFKDCPANVFRPK